MKIKLLIITCLLLLMGANAVNAQFLPIPDKEYNKSFVVAKGDTALAKSRNLVGSVVNAGSFVLAGIAILLTLTGAIQMITANGNEEAFDKAKKIILYSVLGLVMIAMSNELATILDLRDGGILGDPSEIRQRFVVFDKSVNIVITFIKYVIGAVAILMLVMSGANMVAKGGNEEEVEKEKKRIGYVSLGLVSLIFVDNLIKNVLYKIDKPLSDPTIDVTQGIRELVSFTNLIITFVGPVAILTLVAGGAMYVFSAGNDETQEKAKKMIFTSLAGIILIYGAFGIVTTIIAGKF